jgi:hypothetical protein
VGALEVNKLIVESHNDKIFIEKLTNILNIDNLEISQPLCSIDEFICLDGLGNLEKKLNDMKIDELDRLGILLDADEAGVKKRISEINAIFKKVGIEIELKNTNEFQKDTKNDIEIACHILNINDKGSLDHILKTIAKEKSEYADCLEAWKKCLEEKGETISETVFIKFWVNNYLRFDTCSKEEQKRTLKRCNFEKALEKDAWNFEHEALDSLKTFLKLFE